jgi:hypothetical protein
MNGRSDNNGFRTPERQQCHNNGLGLESFQTPKNQMIKQRTSPPPLVRRGPQRMPNQKLNLDSNSNNNN